MQVSVNSRLAKLRRFYRADPGWFIMVFSLAMTPFFPEYIAPFFTLFGFLIFKNSHHANGLKIKLGGFGKLEFAFMGYMLLTVFWSQSKLNSLFIPLLWMGMYLMQTMIYNLCDTQEKLDKVISVVVIAAAVCGAIGAVQMLTYYLNAELNFPFVLPSPLLRDVDQAVFEWLPFNIITKFHKERSSSTYNNPNLFATYMVIAYGLGVYRFVKALQGKNKKKKKNALFHILIIALGLSATQTRIALMVVAVSAIVLLVRLHKYKFKTQAIGTAGALMCLIPGFTARFIPLLRESIGNLRRHMDDTQAESIMESIMENEGAFMQVADQSAATHFDIWFSVAAYIVTHAQAFFIGIGSGMDATWQVLLEQFDINQPHAHNFVLEFWIEGGIIGLGLFLAIIVYAFYRLNRIDDSAPTTRILRACVKVSLVGYLIFGLSDFLYNSPKQIILFFILMGIIQAICRIYAPEETIDVLLSDSEKEYAESKS
ncbi:MAG: O-antigen ligase family protein [Clostridiales bacterium]|nr:O-antigen ligase family protein [Clostridiales bacterium]